MREIKFRAWKNSEMKYSDSFPDLSCFFCLAYGQMREELGLLMQYTGLKDKKGKELYEGDIVSSNGKNTEYYYIVQFGDNNYGGVLGWELVDKNGNENKYYYGTRASNLSDYYEIIGNIYENPELLSGN